MAIKCKDEELIGEAPSTFTEEEVNEEPRTRPTPVTTPTSLGKTLKAVQNVHYDNLIPGVTTTGATVPLKVATVGNGYLRTRRPLDLADPIRTEFKKFWTTDTSPTGFGMLRYVNNSFDAGTENFNPTIDDAYGGTVFSLSKKANETSEVLEGDLFPTYSQAYEIRGSEFVFKQFNGQLLDDVKGAGTSENLWGTFVWGNQEVAGGGRTPVRYQFGEVEDFKRQAPLIPWGNYSLQGLKGIQSDAPEFQDHYFEFNIPFSAKEIELYVNNVNNPASIKLESDYDFYQAGYENTILTETIPEGILPNLYSLFSKDENFQQQRQSLLSTVPNVSTRKTYLRDWARAVRMPENEDAISELSRRFQSVVIPPNQIGPIKMINGFRQYEKMFPMNINTILTTEDSGQFMQALEASGLVEQFLKASVNEFSKTTVETTVTPEETFGTGVFQSILDTGPIASNSAFHGTGPTGPIASNSVFDGPGPGTSQGTTGVVGADPTITEDPRKFSTSLIHSFANFAQSRETVINFLPMGIQKSADFTEGALELLDFEQWLTRFSNSIYDVRDNFWDETIFLGIPPNAIEQSAGCQSFANTLSALIMTAKVNEFMQNNSNVRTWEEMLSGAPCVNETLVYEIVQRDANDVLNSVQNIFIPNTSPLSLLQYIDTQAKYNKPYIYEIYAHQLVVGTKYKYWLASRAGQRYPELEIAECLRDLPHHFGVDWAASLKVVRIPIYRQNITLLDDAPMPPNVDMVPYKDVSCQFLINLNGAVGNMEAFPIAITEEDASYIEDYRTARNLDPWDKFAFSSDDPSGRYEIFRLDTPPHSYSDFANSLLTTIGSREASSASYISSIKPNKKYYYMFRAIDIHNHKSNPSSIYEVELVENNGMVFFNVSIFKISASSISNRLSPTKEFRRYLKINPNMLQSLVNYKASGLENANSATDTNIPPILGRAEKSVWNKQYKIRVTSKNSGRKFDINLRCRVKYRPKIDGR